MDVYENLTQHGDMYLFCGSKQKKFQLGTQI